VISTYLHLYTFNRIVVSVCAGKGETEMNAKGDLCLCLDIDKKSLFSSFFFRKFRLKQPPNIIAHYHDMGIDIPHLLTHIGLSTHLPVVVLFQHPSPSKQCKSQIDFISASRDCISAIMNGFIKSIHYVYDHNPRPGSTSWSKDKIVSSILTSWELGVAISQDLFYSEERTIGEMNLDTVDHPLFGVVPRSGWAGFKCRSLEKTFSITTNL